jgi:hypothetical protein
MHGMILSSRLATALVLALAGGLMFGTGTLQAASLYGTAAVEEGTLTIIRSGRSIEFKSSPEEIQVEAKDLLRVRENSRVLLKPNEKAVLTLGSNAVFQVEPWQSGDNGGFMRALFGRFRATVTGLAGNERFNVKTATATIGVKGTEYRSAVTSGGQTAAMGEEHTTTLAGRDGVEQPVNAGQLSVTVGSSATVAVTAPEEFRRSMESLNSPEPTSRQAQDFPAQDALIKAGVLAPDAGARMRQEKGDAGSAGGRDEISAPQIDLDAARQAGSQNVMRLKPDFGK